MIERRIYIIPKGKPITDAVLKAATKANCPEIAQGIPPRFKNEIDESALPVVYVEKIPEPIQLIDRDLQAELDVLKADLKEKGIL